MNIKIPLKEHNVAVAKERITTWKIPESVKNELVKFLEELAIGKVNRGRRISESTQIKYIRVLRCPLEFFNKPLAKLVVKDIEDFEKALYSGKLQSWKKKSYSHSMKCDMHIALKILLRWRLGDVKTMKLAGWLETRDKKKTPDYLKESEILKLYKACKSASERFLIAVLFDAGARAEEFHNIRYEDIELPKEGENYVEITIKEEYSKTNGRRIALFWKHSLEAVQDFLKERELEGMRLTEPVYNRSYDATRKFLQRLGNKILSKSVHYHLFRHSSATYYATEMTGQELSYRYGWKLNSEMLNVYINRSGMETKKLSEKFTQTDITKLQKQFEEQAEENRIMQDRQKKMQEEMDQWGEIANMFRSELDYQLKVGLRNKAEMGMIPSVKKKDSKKFFEFLKSQELKPLEKLRGDHVRDE